MLAIPHLSQVSSMAEIDSKEAQMKLKAGICFRTYLTQQAHFVFISTKKHKLQCPIPSISLSNSNINHQSSFDFPSLASLGHNDPETPYTASGFIGLADSDPFCVLIFIEQYYCWYDYVATVVVSSAGDFIFRDSHDASTRERSLCENKDLCMRTRSQARRLRQQQRQKQQVPPNLVEPPKDTMADNRTMAELLQAPTEGYEDAIVVPEIAAANFEIKHGLLTLVQNKQFFGHDKEDPHAHIRAPGLWLEKEPPRSIQTWDDLVAKFINQFFPPSKTTNLRNEITNFKQRFDESFSEAWDRFKDLSEHVPLHGFSSFTN
ncbi:reverse transcriptase domain-containing protein [Tanacetum coccineum]